MAKYFVSKIEKGFSRKFELIESFFLKKSNFILESIRCLPMILSTFSHYSITHLAMNLVVLYSFSELSMRQFGKENFLALYLSSGVMSSFISCLHKVLSNSFVPSLGAVIFKN